MSELSKIDHFCKKEEIMIKFAHIWVTNHKGSAKSVETYSSSVCQSNSIDWNCYLSENEG